MELARVNVAVLLVTDAHTSADEATVKLIIDRLASAGHHLAECEVLADKQQLIRGQFLKWIADPEIDVVITVAGVETSATQPALEPSITKPIEGFSELVRMISYEEIGTGAMLVDVAAAQCGSTFVFVLPASMGAVRSAFDKLLIPQLDSRTKPRNLTMRMPRLKARIDAVLERPSPPPPPPRARLTPPVPIKVIVPARTRDVSDTEVDSPAEIVELTTPKQPSPQPSPAESHAAIKLKELWKEQSADEPPPAAKPTPILGPVISMPIPSLVRTQTPPAGSPTPTKTAPMSVVAAPPVPPRTSSPIPAVPRTQTPVAGVSVEPVRITAQVAGVVPPRTQTPIVGVPATPTGVVPPRTQTPVAGVPAAPPHTSTPVPGVPVAGATASAASTAANLGAAANASNANAVSTAANLASAAAIAANATANPMTAANTPMTAGAASGNASSALAANAPSTAANPATGANTTSVGAATASNPVTAASSPITAGGSGAASGGNAITNAGPANTVASGLAITSAGAANAVASGTANGASGSSNGAESIAARAVVVPTDGVTPRRNVLPPIAPEPEPATALEPASSKRRITDPESAVIIDGELAELIEPDPPPRPPPRPTPPPLPPLPRKVPVGTVDDIPTFLPPRIAEPPLRRRRKNNVPLILAALAFLASAGAAGVVMFTHRGGGAPKTTMGGNPPPVIPNPPDPRIVVVVPDAAEDPAVQLEPDPPVDAAVAEALKPPDPTPTRRPRNPNPNPNRNPNPPKPDPTPKPPKPEPPPKPDDVVKAPTNPQGGGECDEVSCILEKYARPCCARYRPADPTPTPKPIGGPPETLDKTMIRAGVERVRPAIIRCGEITPTAKGTVKVSVSVTAEGGVSNVSVVASPDDALGQCVAGAVRRASFAKTLEGATFSYPFVF